MYNIFNIYVIIILLYGGEKMTFKQLEAFQKTAELEKHDKISKRIIYSPACFK